MAAQRKRKHAVVEEHATGGPNGSIKLQKRIKSFGHVSKPNEEEIIVGLKKLEHRSGLKAQPAPAVQSPPRSDKKRKRVIDATTEEDDTIAVPVQSQQSEPPSTPRNKRVRNAISPSPARSAAALFDRLNINRHSSFIGSDQVKASYETPPATPEADEASALHHLESMYASFLSAISLHCSHHGSSSPIGIQTLLPIITKHWKKRRVSLDDVRMLLVTCQGSGNMFSLQDYGRAGICLTLSQTWTGLVNEKTLQSQFNAALQKTWQEWRTNTTAASKTVEIFIDQIQLPTIQKHESVDKTASIFTKGQQRLADIKSTSAAAQLATNTAKIVGGQVTTPTPAVNRGSALLDRILAKQNLASTLPAGPTKAQLERRSALDRVEDITRVLCVLAGVKDRVSFSMAVITQHLQQSLRNPIGSAEVQRCLALMATEVMPEFVKVVMSEGVHGVVVTRSGNVGLGELRARLERACR